jgi:hypothetical protein
LLSFLTILSFKSFFIS